MGYEVSFKLKDEVDLRTANMRVNRGNVGTQYRLWIGAEGKHYLLL